ncbi:MAG: MFS transporter [Planctomycetes bacterium]|nr:MFS transporter [Planctomycetota bacterium]
MSVRREEFVEQRLKNAISSFDGHPKPKDPARPIEPRSRLTGRDAIRIFECELLSRLIDLEARRLKNRDEGYYTIGSSGHEVNAVVGHLLRTTDPALLHYRSGGFMMARLAQRPGETPLFDTMLSLVASAEDPVSGGRHKVWGSVSCWVPPQTSTIASQLPKAVGVAFALERAKSARVAIAIPNDSIVCVSFGDASINHASAQTAFNAAAWCEHQHLPLPLLFLCEDNGIGISVKTPGNWVTDRFSTIDHIDYFQADGRDLLQSYEVAAQAIDHCRSLRRPTFLHLDVVRLLGHAGSDIESTYRQAHEIEESEARDPLIAHALFLLREGLIERDEMLAMYERLDDRVRATSREAVGRPKLTSLDELVRPLRVLARDAVRAEADRTDFQARRVQRYGSEERLPERGTKARTLNFMIAHGLTEILAKYDQAICFGEDVAKKGGVYGATAGLLERFGAARVFNTLLDETSILGLANGAGLLGYLPIPEIQYLAYLHNAEDQLRGEACSLAFFADSKMTNPMLIRIAGFSYQRGFGGHFHNDNALGVLRDVPGLIIASPSRGDDAVKMLRTCAALAMHEKKIVVFLEPIALYAMPDLHEPKDEGWSTQYPPPGTSIGFDDVGVYEHGDDEHLTIVSYANGLYLSLQAARVLKERHGITARVIDVRWIAPLPLRRIREEAERTGRCLVVDECRHTGGGIAEALLAHLMEEGSPVIARRLTAADTYIALGPGAPLATPTRDSIVEKALELAATQGKPSEVHS